jgi:hypothetical protein
LKISLKFSGKIVLKKEEKLKEIIQFFKLIAKHLAAMVGKNLGSTKNQPKSMVDGQPVQHKSQWSTMVSRTAQNRSATNSRLTCH